MYHYHSISSKFLMLALYTSRRRWLSFFILEDQVRWTNYNYTNITNPRRYFQS